MPEENETKVVEKPAVAVESTTTETAEEVSSPEVKEDVQPVTKEAVQKNDTDISKMQAQIDNLNIALRQERESGKTASKELAEKLERSQETIDKLKEVFSPAQKEEIKQEAISMDQIEELLEKRDSQKKEETQKEMQANAIKEEIAKLEKDWNGENGKPKYDDAKVLKWQEENSKLHLSPSEAFNEMSRDTIIDWEIKNRMSKKPEVQNVETPGGTPNTREPQEKTLKTDADIRSAVLEAMENASDENNN